MVSGSFTSYNGTSSSSTHTILFVSTKTEHSKFNFSIKQKKWAESGLPNSAHKTGIVLLSHTVAGTVPSPLMSLTAEFGMGSGVSSSLSTPKTLRLSALKIEQICLCISILAFCPILHSGRNVIELDFHLTIAFPNKLRRFKKSLTIY